MKLSQGSRPSPALVLAALALVFAMVGTALAGPDAISNKITKPKVKKISKKQANKAIDKRESSLNVNSAATLGNFAADDLVRSAFAQDDDDARVGPVGPGPILTRAIQVPTSGYLLINAGSDVFGDPSFGTCAVSVDGTEIDSSFRTWELGVDNEEEDCTTETTVPVSAGTRTVVFEDVDGIPVDVQYDEAELQILFVPFGADGSQPAARAASAAGGDGSTPAGN
jgi:hypothetical protein